MNKAHELLKWASDISQYDNESATHLAKAVVHIAKAQQTGEFDVHDYARLWDALDKLTKVANETTYLGELLV